MSELKKLTIQDLKAGSIIRNSAGQTRVVRSIRVSKDSQYDYVELSDGGYLGASRICDYQKVETE